MTEIQAHDGSEQLHNLLGDFTADDLREALGGKDIGAKTQVISTNAIEKNTIISIAWRDRICSNYIKEIREMHNVYCKLKGIPRPDRYPKQSAHLIAGAENWNNIVVPDKSDDDVSLDHYIAFAKADEIRMLKRDDRGAWWRYSGKGDPKKQSLEDNPNQWRSEAEMTSAFKDAEFIDRLKREAVALLIQKYRTKSEYDAFRKRQFGDGDNAPRLIPDEIDREVCRRSGWKFD